MDSVLKQAFFALTIFSFCAVSVYATSVAVHDPSVVLVYKDAAGKFLSRTRCKKVAYEVLLHFWNANGSCVFKRFNRLD